MNNSFILEWTTSLDTSSSGAFECGGIDGKLGGLTPMHSYAPFVCIRGTVGPLVYDPPHERPPAIYDHISCNGW